MVMYLLQLAAWVVFMAALILWPAGTLAYPGAWAFIALITIAGLATILWLSKHSPSLLRERMASPLQRDQKPWDWRSESPIRPVVFEDSGRMDEDVVHLHLEVRRVRDGIDVAKTPPERLVANEVSIVCDPRNVLPLE